LERDKQRLRGKWVGWYEMLVFRIHVGCKTKSGFVQIVRHRLAAHSLLLGDNGDNSFCSWFSVARV